MHLCTKPPVSDIYASARLRMGARAHANFDNRCAVQRRIRQPVMFCTKVPFTGRKTALYH